MAFFETGTIYRNRFEIKHVVSFFNGELAVGETDGKRFYLQAAYLHKQPPQRAIQQFRNLKSSIVLPYQDVLVEEDLLVFVRPYSPIRPLKDVIKTDLSEEQVIDWTKQLLHLEAMLRSKPIPMYLLLDTRNIGVTKSGELQVIFCGLEKIMVTETKLDWGSFFYSLLSGQFLEGSILKIPKDFSVSRPMMKLIQKTLKVYQVDQVIAQIEIFEKKHASEGLLKRFLPSSKKSSSPKDNKITPSEDANLPITKPDLTPANTSSRPKPKPNFSMDQLAGMMQKREETSAVSTGTNKTNKETPRLPATGQSLLEQLAKMSETSSGKTVPKQEEPDELLQEIDQMLESAPATNTQQKKEDDTLAQVKKKLDKRNNIRFRRGVQLATCIKKTAKPEVEIEISEGNSLEKGVRELDSNEKQTTKPKPMRSLLGVPDPSKEENTWDEYYEALKLDDSPVIEETEEDLVEDTVSFVTLDDLEDDNMDKQETTPAVETPSSETADTEPTPQTQTYKVNPALAKLADQDLSDSFIITLDQHRQEHEEKQQARIEQMRKQFEAQQQQLLEQKRLELERMQQKLLEEQRKELERQEQELLAKEQEALEKARKEREEKERQERAKKEKERIRKARLEYERQQWEQRELQIMEKEQKLLETQQQEMLDKLLKEFEEKKQALLEKQKREFEERKREKLTKLHEILSSSSENSSETEDEFATMPPSSYQAIQPLDETERAEKERELMTYMGHALPTPPEQQENQVEEQVITEPTPLKQEKKESPTDQKGEEKSTPPKKEIQEAKPKADKVSETKQEKPKKSPEKTLSETKQKSKSYSPFSSSSRSMSRADKQRAARAALQQSFSNHQNKKEEKRKKKQEKKQKSKQEESKLESQEGLLENGSVEVTSELTTKEAPKQKQEKETKASHSPKKKEKRKQEQQVEKKQEVKESSTESNQLFSDEEDEALFIELGNLFDELELSQPTDSKTKNADESTTDSNARVLSDRYDELDRLLEEEERKAAEEEKDQIIDNPEPLKKQTPEENQKQSPNPNSEKHLQDFMNFFQKK
ncbi:DUF4670 domain-containing protein [Risungbinella massiliensis]|uniref:hypothetical protein n=1 Tax=Risungbinella massiliensis TaxID=1329796 RepID=UPI0005CBE790|nr:hypothetical protein [Risungbinella massiliensis]